MEASVVKAAIMEASVVKAATGYRYFYKIFI